MDRLTLAGGSATHRGQRAENQDRCLVRSPVFAVADGMGGHASGAAASEIAVARLAEVAHGPTVEVDALRAALQRADGDIRALAAGTSSAEAPGTTVAGVALIESGGGVYWAAFHVGDSRIYRWTPGCWERVSTDHSVVQELVDGGAITEEQALTHPERHVITRALGVGRSGEAEFTLLPVEGGERFLVCSDGLTDVFSDEQLGELLAGVADPPGQAEELVAQAVAAGAADNVSAVVVHADPLPLGGEVPVADIEATVPRLPGASAETEGAR